MKRGKKRGLKILQKVNLAKGTKLLHQRINKDYPEEIVTETPDWSDEDNHLIGLLIEAGELRHQDKYFDISCEGFAPSDVFCEKYLCLTNHGYDRLDSAAKSWTGSALKNILNNIPTMLVSIFGAVLLSWAIFYFGPIDSN